MMDTNISNVSLTGPANLHFVETLLDELEALYRAAQDVSDEDRTYFSLAVSEIATNIVTYSVSESEVAVTADLVVDDVTLSARLGDDAEPVHVRFEDAELPDEMAESGRGLAIATMALDQLSHELDEGNVWKLVRNRRP